jgi:uncharacterized protein (TIGR02246 family)
MDGGYQRGDAQAVLNLMTDDAVFLVAGRPPMSKAAFASAAGSAGAERPVFDGISDIKEIYVEGSVGYLWSHLTVTVTPPQGSASIKRSGQTLTVFRKIEGRWLLACDANLLVRV